MQKSNNLIIYNNDIEIISDNIEISKKMGWDFPSTIVVSNFLYIININTTVNEGLSNYQLQLFKYNIETKEINNIYNSNKTN